MALSYNFVTPLTSLIVVQTNVSSMENGTNSTTSEEDGGNDGQREDAGLGVPTSGGGAGGGGGVFSGSSSVGLSQLCFQSVFTLLVAMMLTKLVF